MSDFRVQGKIALDGAGFFSTLNRARGAVSSFGGALAGAFSVGAIAGFTKGVIALAGKLNDVADALNINVEFLQRFVNSAKLSGGSLEDFEKFIATTQRSRQAALNDPKGKDAQSFGKLGIGAGGISTMSNQQLTEAIMQSMASGITADKTNALYEVGGKSAAKLAAGFRDGLSDKPIMTAEQIAIIDDIGDSFSELYQTLQVSLAPALLYIVDTLQIVLDAIDQFVAGAAAIIAGTEANEQKDAEDRANREAQLKKFETQLAGKVSSGKMTQTEADAAMADVKAKSRITQSNATFTQGVKDEAAEQSARDEARAARRAARRAAAEAGVPPMGADPKKEKDEKGSIYSDSRLSVGGFLGQGAGSMATIAQKQLEIQTQSLDFLKKIDASLGDKGSITV
jgi:hypothetical protein